MSKYLFYLTEAKEDELEHFFDSLPVRPEGLRDFYNSLKQNIKARELRGIKNEQV